MVCSVLFILFVFIFNPYVFPLALVLDVDSLNEVTFVHQEQIFGLQSDVSNLQNTDEQLDARITNLENNGSGSSNTTG